MRVRLEKQNHYSFRRIQMIYNFGAGPAMLPIPVMEKAQKELLSFNQMGVSVIEVSHRSKWFDDVINEAGDRTKRLLKLGDDSKCSSFRAVQAFSSA